MFDLELVTWAYYNMPERFWWMVAGRVLFVGLVLLLIYLVGMWVKSTLEMWREGDIKLLSINLNRASGGGGRWFSWKRIYYKGYKWTLFILARRRQTSPISLTCLSKEDTRVQDQKAD